jgi:hypothetical protein
MSVVQIEDIPGSTRIWIYGCERPLSDIEARQLDDHMKRFLMEWTAHKRELRTAWRLEYSQFIILAVDESMMAASGCSIDSMVRNLRVFQEKIGVEIVNTASRVFFRDGSGRIRCVERQVFRELAEQGEVDAGTVVFNNTLLQLGEFRAGRWEVPMSQSWHIDVFGKALQQ